jgi:hypothetical protein
MADATAVVQRRGREQFQGLFSDMWAIRGTINVDSLADGVGDNDAVAAPGVALGDMVIGVALGVDVAGIIVTGWVSAANVVTLRFQNESGGLVDLAATPVRVLVGRPAW